MFKMNKDTHLYIKLNVTNLSIRRQYEAFTVQSAETI